MRIRTINKPTQKSTNISTKLSEEHANTLSENDVNVFLGKCRVQFLMLLQNMSVNQATGPPRSGAGVGVGMLRGAGDSINWNYEFPNCQFFKFQIATSQFFNFRMCIFPKFIVFNCQVLIFRIIDLQVFKFSNFKFTNFKQLGTQTSQHFHNSRFSDMKNNMFQGCSHISCTFEVFWW